MKFTVRLISETPAGQREESQLTVLDKTVLGVEDIGLTLAEAKALLKRLQERIVEAQIQGWLEGQRPCACCGRARRLKGYHPVQFRTVFGTVKLRSPRLYRCACEAATHRSWSPLRELLGTHTAPELLYLESKWASTVSYGTTVALLKEVLPVDARTNAESVRHHLHRVAECAEAELGHERGIYIDGCQREWAELPAPEGPITVGLDGGYVRGRHGKSRTEGHFEVIAGKSITWDGASKCFGFVHKYDAKPKRRLFELLKSQGLQMNQ